MSAAPAAAAAAAAAATGTSSVALGWDGAITIVVLALGLIVMMADWLAPHLTFTLMVGVLMAATVIDTKAGAAGFSNTGVLTVVVLYVVAEGVSQTGGLDLVMSRVLGKSRTSPRAALVRMMLPVAIASAFLNNTPIVALMIPILISWGRRCNVSPKVLLLPLSYASIFGGTTTLIGTSTNLVIAGLQSKRYAGTPNASFNFFDITPYGLPYGVWGFAFVVLIGILLLPKDTGSRPKEDLLLAAKVEDAPSQVVGKTMAQSGLLELSGLRLCSVVRSGDVIFRAAADPKGAGLLGRLVGRWKEPAGAPGPSNAPRPAAGGPGSEAGAGGPPPPGVVVDIRDDHGAGGGKDVAAAPDPVKLQPCDLLYFQGDLKQLQLHGERLGFALVTSNHEDLQQVLHAATRGQLTLAPSSSQTARSAAAAACPGSGLATACKGGEGNSILAGRRASLGWSGATMWLFRAHVKKGSSVIGREVGGVEWWATYGVIVIGAELGSKDPKGARAATLGQLVLKRGDLLVFTARNDFNYSTSAFAEDFEKVEFLHDQKPKDFLIALRVKPRGGAAGRDIAANGLKDINGLHIVAVERPSTHDVFHQATPTLVLKGDDVLWFATDVEGVRYVLKDPRLEAAEGGAARKLRARQIHQQLVQVTVAPDSALIGHTARQLRFRTYFQGAILALHRASGSLELRSPADVQLDAGDVLLLEAATDFTKRFSTSPAFGLVSAVPNSSPLKSRLMWPAVALAVAMVATQIISGFTGVSYIDLWPAAILTAAAMLLVGCMNTDQALRSIDWTVYITVAFAFGVSSAMEKSKVAQAIASVFVAIARKIGGQTAALGSMYLVTGLLSEVLTNNAAAALMYPIAANVGDDMGIQPKIMSIAVMLGASAAFISPFGYQCNLMVFTAGQYRTADFVKVGVLLQVWQLLGACVILSLPNHAIILSAASLAFVALTVGYAVASSLLARRRAKRDRELLAAV